MSAQTKMPDLSRVEKRGIEALAMTPYIKAVAQEIGLEEALALLQDVNEVEAYQRGLAARESGAPNDIEALALEVESWGQGGVWETHILEQTPTTFFFDVTRCPYYDKYRELGVEEFGYAFSCCRDAPHARGFNPGLKLVRTKTIMQGHGVCDFRYYLQKE